MLLMDLLAAWHSSARVRGRVRGSAGRSAEAAASLQRCSSPQLEVASAGYRKEKAGALPRKGNLLTHCRQTTTNNSLLSFSLSSLFFFRLSRRLPTGPRTLPMHSVAVDGAERGNRRDGACQWKAFSWLLRKQGSSLHMRWGMLQQVAPDAFCDSQALHCIH